jgi:hypothetical protein
MLEYKPMVTTGSNASGAYQAACNGQVVVVVDVIDMSTTLEAALQEGALYVLGASPVSCRAPVPVNPTAVGSYAAQKAKELNSEVVVIAEPRIGNASERLERAAGCLEGLHSGGIQEIGVYPNQGAETAKLVDFKDKIVRTPGYTGWDNARNALNRAFELAEKEERGIALIAASSKALEDVLAVHYLAEYLLNK